jgi:hypothetical protein
LNHHHHGCINYASCAAFPGEDHASQMCMGQ